MKEIAVLTYNQKHRKTYDTLCLLKAKGYHKIKVYAQPMTYTKKCYPLVTHRPELTMDVPCPLELCKNLGYEYVEGNFAETVTDPDALYLLCGAGLLREDFVKRYRIINSHPGYIPLARGLDAYKWSVINGIPLGVTTHFLGDYVDAGEIIERREIKVGEYDTFHSVAQRIYETETDMLVGAIPLADKKHEFVIPDSGEIFRRMSQRLEKDLFAAFERYKADFFDGRIHGFLQKTEDGKVSLEGKTSE